MHVSFVPELREAIGVVVPFDMELDAELWRWVPADIDLLITRTPYAPHRIDENFVREISRLQPVTAATRDVTTGRARVVAYGCASGSFIGGPAGERELRDAMEGAGAHHAVTTAGAIIEALAHVGATRAALATPYVVALSAHLESFLAAYDVATVAHGALGLDGRIWAVDQHVTADLIRRIDAPEADAIVVSCTNLATYDIIAPLEEELGKPIITANQATMWAALRRLGREAVGAGQHLLSAAGAIPIVPAAFEPPAGEAETIA